MLRSLGGLSCGSREHFPEGLLCVEGFAFYSPGSELRGAFSRVGTVLLRKGAAPTVPRCLVSRCEVPGIKASCKASTNPGL